MVDILAATQLPRSKERNNMGTKVVRDPTSNLQERAICIDKESRFFGWVFYKHPDGQWVTLRKASDPEIRSAEFCVRCGDEYLIEDLVPANSAPSGPSVG